MIKLNPYIVTILCLSLAVSGTPAWAVQSHGGSEGLVSHQIGHFLFVAGIGYLLFRINSLKITGPGWRDFKVFLVLLVAWNLLTFTGHILDEIVDRSSLVRTNGAIHSFHLDGAVDLIYYVTRLDHLVLVPSFLFFLFALRKWSQQ